MISRGHKLNPSRPDPGRRGKINLNFYFYTFLWCLKRFYEGLILFSCNFLKYTGREGLISNLSSYLVKHLLFFYIRNLSKFRKLAWKFIFLKVADCSLNLWKKLIKIFWLTDITPYYLVAIATFTAKDHALKIFSKLFVQYWRKMGNKSHNLTYCFSLQPMTFYNFCEVKSNFWLYFETSLTATDFLFA